MQPLRHCRVGGVQPHDEADALVNHQINAPLDHILGQLHIGNAVSQQPSGPLLPLDDGDGVAPVVELVRGGQPRRAGAHHGHLLPGPLGRAAALHSPLGVGVLNDAQLVVPDGDALAVQAADAGPLAGGGTHPARGLREIVGFQQAAEGVAGVSGVDHIVPLRDQVVQRTAEDAPLPVNAGLAVGYAAVHAPSSLLPPDLLRQRKAERLPVPHPLLRRTVRDFPPDIFQKTCDLSHNALTPCLQRKTLPFPPAPGSCPSPPAGQWRGASCRNPWA